MQHSHKHTVAIVGLAGIGLAMLLHRRRRNHLQTMKILVLSYEFTFSPFSGNGVLARSLVKGLLACGHNVVVCCCKPHAESPGISKDNPIVSDNLRVEPVELDVADGWRRLDDTSAWQRYTEGVKDLAARGRLSFSSASSASSASSTSSASSAPNAVIAIDWTGGAAWRRIRALLPKTPMLYVNFRVYSSGFSGSEADAARAAWHDARESEALTAADRILALSTHDQASLRSLLPPGASKSKIGLLLPCLRGDMEALAQQPAEVLVKKLPAAVAQRLAKSQAPRPPSSSSPLPSSSSSSPSLPPLQRRLLVCGVRLSTEKNPLLFARVLERLAPELASRGVVPLLFGATAEAEYAAEVQRLVVASGGLVLEQFLGPEDMAALYAVTRLNFHPCLYDAYGMSVVEAAAFGAPSVVNGGATIGASALLGLGGQDGMGAGCIALELLEGRDAGGEEIGALADRLLDSIDDAEALERVAREGRARALGWGEEACGRKLHEEILQNDVRSSAAGL